MPRKTARSAPRPSFGMPKVTVAVGTSRLCSTQAGKALIFASVRESSGQSRLNGVLILLTVVLVVLAGVLVYYASEAPLPLSLTPRDRAAGLQGVPQAFPRPVIASRAAAMSACFDSRRAARKRRIQSGPHVSARAAGVAGALRQGRDRDPSEYRGGGKVCYGPIGRGFIEAHHVEAIGLREGNTTTNIRDLIPVCSNCHRMMHRKVPPYKVEEIASLMSRAFEQRN
jgi:hypothetical protein